MSKSALVLALVPGLGVASTAAAGSGRNGVFNLGVVNTINSYVTTLTGSMVDSHATGIPILTLGNVDMMLLPL